MEHNLSDEELDLMLQDINSMDEEEFDSVFRREVSLEEAQSTTLDIFPDPDIPLHLQQEWINEGFWNDEFDG